MRNQVRIIAGAWRGRALRFPSVDALRPTPDRVRETVFNWLGQDLTGRVCLDLFAGSGAFSFEALSRGAALAVCVERNPVAVKGLLENAQRLGAAHMELHREDALRFLERDNRDYDLIFVDPPFAENWLPRLWHGLAARLRADGLLYIEAARPVVSTPDWTMWRQDKAGKVHYHLLRKALLTHNGGGADANSRLSGDV